MPDKMIFRLFYADEKLWAAKTECQYSTSYDFPNFLPNYFWIFVEKYFMRLRYSFVDAYAKPNPLEAFKLFVATKWSFN